MSRTPEIIEHLLNLCSDESLVDSPGICASCPRYVDKETWPESCYDCIFHSLHNREHVTKSLKILKTIALIEE